MRQLIKILVAATIAAGVPAYAATEINYIRTYNIDKAEFRASIL